MRSVAGIVPHLPRSHAVLTVLGLVLIALGLGWRFGAWAGLVAGGAALVLVAVLIELDSEDRKPAADRYRS